MFLYWRKRGAYELEALPSALAGLEPGAVERFSWSSTLDIIEDLGGRCGPSWGAVRGLPPSPCRLPVAGACGLAPVRHSLSPSESRCWRGGAQQQHPEGLGSRGGGVGG